MAKKQKKKRNKKYRQKYTTGGRLDMRNGGRVGYQTGDMVKGNPVQQTFQRNKMREEEVANCNAVKLSELILNLANSRNL